MRNDGAHTCERKLEDFVERETSKTLQEHPALEHRPPAFKPPTLGLAAIIFVSVLAVSAGLGIYHRVWGGPNNGYRIVTVDLDHILQNQQKEMMERYRNSVGQDKARSDEVNRKIAEEIDEFKGRLETVVNQVPERTVVIPRNCVLNAGHFEDITDQVQSEMEQRRGKGGR